MQLALLIAEASGGPSLASSVAEDTDSKSAPQYSRRDCSLGMGLNKGPAGMLLHGHISYQDDQED